MREFITKAHYPNEQPMTHNELLANLVIDSKEYDDVIKLMKDIQDAINPQQKDWLNMGETSKTTDISPLYIQPSYFLQLLRNSKQSEITNDTR